MKALLKFCLWFFGILFLSAILSPFLYKVFPKLSEFLSQYLSFMDADAFDWKFERIYNRLVMIFSLTVLFIAVKKKKFDFPKESIRWTRENKSVSLFFWGFFWGLLLLVSIAVIKIFLGVTEFRWAEGNLGFWLERIGMSLLSAMIIGIIEEIFFRGFCFVTVLKKMKGRIVFSIIIVNVFYALLHYVQGKKPFIGPDPSVIDGLKLMAAPFMSLADFQPILPGVVGLFIYGVILSLVYLRTRSLYPCIGIHAGCVFFLKIDGAVFFHHAVNPLIYGTNNCYDGVLGWLTLILMGWGMITFFSQNKYRLSVSLGVVFLVTCCFTGHPAWAQQDSRSQTSTDEAPLSALEMWKQKKKMLDKYEDRDVASQQNETIVPRIKTVENKVSATTKQSLEDLSKNPQSLDLQSKSRTNEVEASTPQPLLLERKKQEKAIPEINGAKELGYEDAFSSEIQVERKTKAFDLMEDLQDAKMVNLSQDTYETVYGKWKDGTFYFKEDKNAVISIQEQVIGGDIHEGVFLEALPKTIRRIQFNGLQSGKKLILGYGMLDKVYKKDQTQTIYLKVWLGDQLLQRIPIFNDKGWKEESIDLGAAQFLRDPLTLTFEFRADDVLERHLLFDAKIR